jgi:transposase
MDTSKQFFQLHGVDAAEQPVLRRKLRRREVLPFFSRLEATLIVLEACGGSHYWARALVGLGHEVKLIAPQRAIYRGGWRRSRRSVPSSHRCW